MFSVTHACTVKHDKIKMQAGQIPFAICNWSCIYKATSLKRFNYGKFQYEKMQQVMTTWSYINPTGLRRAKTLWRFDLSECNRVKVPQ